MSFVIVIFVLTIRVVRFPSFLVVFEIKLCRLSFFRMFLFVLFNLKNALFVNSKLVQSRIHDLVYQIVLLTDYVELALKMV